MLNIIFGQDLDGYGQQLTCELSCDGLSELVRD